MIFQIWFVFPSLLVAWNLSVSLILMCSYIWFASGEFWAEEPIKLNNFSFFCEVFPKLDASIFWYWVSILETLQLWNGMNYAVAKKENLRVNFSLSVYQSCKLKICYNCQSIRFFSSPYSWRHYCMNFFCLNIRAQLYFDFFCQRRYFCPRLYLVIKLDETVFLLGTISRILKWFKKI